MGLFVRDSPEDAVYQPEVLPYSAPRPITSSARPVNLSSKTELESTKNRRKNSKWQEDSWDYYDMIGEIWSAANLLSSVVSRVRLYPAFVSSRDSAPKRLQDEESLPEGLYQVAYDATASLEQGTGGLPALLRDYALNIFVSGECYLVREPAKSFTGTPETWSIRSVNELVPYQGRDSQWALKTTRDAQQTELIPLRDSYYVARMWRQHPRYSNEADSSLKAVLDKAEELLLYDRTARTISRSRLNAGILFIPDTISASMGTDGSLSSQPNGDNEAMAPYSDDEADTFEDDLMNALLTPIEDETSASSVAPLIVRGPESAGQQIRHISFERDMDNMFSNRADRALERLIAGLDLPKEAITGLADLKYANAIQVEETLYKAHIEPLILTLCDNLTAVFLKPVLRSHGYTEEEIANVTFWYDPSAITAKPDKASAATDGYDKKIISASAWRRAHDFSESDAPKPDELIQRLALERGIISEPVNDMALRSIAPEMIDEMQKRLQEASPTSVDDIIGGENTESSSAPSSQESPPPPDLMEP